jgi:hypothetical protein
LQVQFPKTMIAFFQPVIFTDKKIFVDLGPLKF